MRFRLTRAEGKRLAACLVAGFVLALMIGDQEGTQNDFGIAFREATSFPRILYFLLVGVAIFFIVTFRPLLVPYVKRPAAAGVTVGFLVLLVAIVLMNWYDPVGKFSDLSTQVSNTNGLSVLPSLFFSWLAYVLWFLCLVLGGAAVITRNRLLGWALAALGAVSAVITFIAHSQLVSFAGGIDHSLGPVMACIGFLVFAGSGLVIAYTHAEEAAPRVWVEAVLAWRPGFPFAVVGAVLAVLAFTSASWFAPVQLNLDFGDLKSDFSGYGLAPLAQAYITWLGYVLVIVGAVLALAGSWLRQRVLSVAAALVGLATLIITVIVIYQLSNVGVHNAKQYGSLWQNLGNGGWVVCIAAGLFIVAGAVAARVGPMPAASDNPVDSLPVRKVVEQARRSTNVRAGLAVALLIAIFYPPTLPTTWQTTIVTQIGPYLLLAVGLNVVVGWAGLLDLGYIAFYGIGSYTTAYITGSLPIKPPSWLHLSPLWAIPFAIAACLIAGVLLGAPTLRLRGDYLAIVTLGFGEIIQVVAINLSGVTGGPTGPNVPNPVLNVGVFTVHFGLDNLPYWYLLLAFLLILVVLFYRLEGSRIGRAWAAVREDEVAAQATGINTTRIKLLAFAIGASTSGLAGVFFATQVGYFDPSLFTLQNSILIVAYVVFGGMGSLTGAIAGAAALTWLPQFLKDQVPLEDRQMWIGVVVLAMMIFRPAGLIPAKRRAAELAGFETAAPDVTAVPASEGL
jgi:ABC-type branched-subunit amino acid transport system permease subunit